MCWLALFVAVCAAMTEQEVLDLIAQKIVEKGMPDCVPPNIAETNEHVYDVCGTRFSTLLNDNGRVRDLFGVSL